MLGAAVSFLTLPIEASGQSAVSLDDTRSNSAFYYHVEPGAPRMEVRVMGSVDQPGIYELAVDTDLDRLLALAGGPTSPVGNDGRTEITLRLYRVTDMRRQLIYEAKLESHLTADEAYPVLQEDDVLMVESRTPRKFGWREGLMVITTLATTALAVNAWAK
jgi:protein involved in polysaccharide export with SLBB domain